MADSFAQDELRAYIDLKLKDPKFLQALHKELKPYYTNDQIQKLDQDEVYKVIVKRGLLESLIKQGEDPYAQTKAGSTFVADEFAPNENIALDDINLKVTIAEMKGLTEYLEKSDPRKKLSVSISFLKNRKKTRAVQASLNSVIDQVGIFSHNQDIYAIVW